MPFLLLMGSEQSDLLWVANCLPPEIPKEKGSLAGSLSRSFEARRAQRGQRTLRSRQRSYLLFVGADASPGAKLLCFGVGVLGAYFASVCKNSALLFGAGTPPSRRSLNGSILP